MKGSIKIYPKPFRFLLVKKKTHLTSTPLNLTIIHSRAFVQHQNSTLKSLFDTSKNVQDFKRFSYFCSALNAERGWLLAQVNPGL